MQTQTETQTSPTTTVAPDDNPNIREPERIDAEITAARKAVISADQTVEKRSAEIICAAVMMMDIMERDQDAWIAFREKADVNPCKGSGWQQREVSRVVWRQFASKPQSRQRTSQYGKAVAVAFGLFKDGTTTTRAALLERLGKYRGVKGLPKAGRAAPKPNTNKPIARQSG